MFYAMKNEMENDIHKYEWLYLYQRNNTGSSSLSELLKTFQIQLHRVNLRGKTKMIKYLMDKDTHGTYVCLLNDQQHASSHAIAVNCSRDPRLILDSYETVALEITVENLDRCCGPQCIFQHISHIGEIVYVPRKSTIDVDYRVFTE